MSTRCAQILDVSAQSATIRKGYRRRSANLSRCAGHVGEYPHDCHRCEELFTF